MNPRPQRRISPLAGKSADQHFNQHSTTAAPPSTPPADEQPAPAPDRKRMATKAPAETPAATDSAPSREPNSTGQSETSRRGGRTLYLDDEIEQRLRGAAFDLPRELRVQGITGLSGTVNYLLGLALTEHEKAWNDGNQYPAPPVPFQRGRQRS